MNEPIDSYLDKMDADSEFTGYSADDVLALACANPRGNGVARKLEAFSGDCGRVYVSFCRYGETRYGYLDGAWQNGKVYVTHWRAIGTERFEIVSEMIETCLLTFAPEGVKYPNIVLSELDKAMDAGASVEREELASRLEDLWFTLHGYR